MKQRWRIAHGVMLAVVGAVVCTSQAAAQRANPALEARIDGINDETRRSRALRLADLDIRVEIAGAVAETTITARFANPGNDTLEGEFSLALPDGAVVSGYALDVNGAMIDGVLVEPRKATTVFEQRVRRGIDPGIAAVSRANVFSTRVYPILPNQGRTIRLRFAAPVHQQHGLSLPLVTTRSVGRVAVVLGARGLERPPALLLPRGLEASWTRESGAFTAAAEMQGRSLGGALHVGPLRAPPALLTSDSRGRRFVQVSDAAATRRLTDGAQRLRVYWDHSLSRRDDDLHGERALLEKFVQETGPATIDLVTFNSSGARTERASGFTALAAMLGAVRYRGATSFAVLEKIALPAADICLVFSDGVATIDARPGIAHDCQMFAITSTPDTDAGFLAWLTGGSSADVLRLDVQSEREILQRMRGGAPCIIDVRDQNGARLGFAPLDAGPGGWSAIVEAPATGELVVRLSGLARGVVERRYTPVAIRGRSFDGAASLWAAERVAELAARDDQHEALVALSRQFSVASPALSFIVLETPADYVEARVAPPANYPKDTMLAYQQALAAWQAGQDARRAARLAKVIAAWEEQKRWWNTRFDPQAKQPAQIAGPALRSADSANAGGVGMTASPVTVPSADGGVDEVVVTGLRASRRTAAEMRREASPQVDASARGIGNAEVRGIRLELEKWNPERPYLAALDAAATNDFERVFADQEATHGALPAFYFDVAEWLHRKQRVAAAMEMLLSALDLPVSNAETIAMVADRMLRYGGLDRAIWLNERLGALAPELPQPRRSLALALATRAGMSASHARKDLRRALQLLNEVVVTPWQDEYDGIELIALMDANALLPRLRSLGEKGALLDERLQALLDVDLRVVLQWNTAATDMDLWVDQPNDERAIYNHPRTSIGGRLSNDMTEGYGPEEFLLRRAIPGVYQIRVNVYASDRIHPNGSTVITARLFRDFGRPTQREETIELELKPGAAGERLVGKFTVDAG